MKKLEQNWFFTDLIDFEYKQYILLAYLKDVYDNFSENKLYPQLSDLFDHYKNLQGFVDGKSKINEGFKGNMTGIDLENFRLIYEKTLNDNDLMSEIESIVQYSMPVMAECLEQGREIYDALEKLMILEPVGIIPIRKDEGYLFVQNGTSTHTAVLSYQQSIFTSNTDRYRALRMTFIDTYYSGIANTLENIKIQLVRTFPQLPNPATYLFATKRVIPFSETLLPMAKRSLMRKLAEA